MAKSVDIGSKRLISLAPDAWARWLTGDATVEVLDVLSGEFQWVSRANDVLIKVHSAAHGTFLIVNEIQLRPDERMAKRMRAYTALAEERYDLDVYPVLVNILPPATHTTLASHYHSEFMGLLAHQDFRVINLWEQEVNLVFEHNLTTLLPFAPILKGGQDEYSIKKAINLLRVDKGMAELEPLLAFFATFVLQSDVVRRIMRWDMAVLRESPWYNEILQEGLEEGLQQGRASGQLEMLLHVLNRRFGDLNPKLVERVNSLHPEQLRRVADVALEATSLSDVTDFLSTLPRNTSGM